jgi:tetratricopeptide (TPR) repeat protein
MMATGTHFRKGIAANLAYWHDQIEQLADTGTHRFSEEQANIILAIELGLALPVTWLDAAQLLLLVYRFIERSGYWQRWTAVFEVAAALDQKQHSLVCARLLNRQGQLLRLMQQTELAMTLHQKAESMAQAAGDQQVLAEIWFNLSIDNWQCRDYQQADAYGQKALQFFESVPSGQRWQASMLNTLGLISQHCDRLTEAQSRLQHSIRLWQQFDEPTELARVFNNLGNVCCEQEHLEAALYYYYQALEQLALTESSLDKAEVLVNLSALYFRQEQYDKAEIVLRQAASSALRSSGHFRLRALWAQNLGNTLLKLNQVTESEKYLRQSLSLWQQLGDDLMLANTEGTLAEALALQGQHEMAIAHYDGALRLLDKFPTNRWAKALRAEFSDGKSTSESLATLPIAGGQLSASADHQPFSTTGVV